MISPTRHSWISGTLELTSKVRYGMTSRGVPIFRFIPYDKRLPPLAVGCSQRNLFHNVHAVVEPSTPFRPMDNLNGQLDPFNCPSVAAPTGISNARWSKEGQLQRANLIQNLGRPTKETEQEVILIAYAYDNSKQQKTFPAYELPPTHAREERPFLEGLTFHIDPPGCKDVDDSFTIQQDLENPDIWNIAINIADVSELVLEGSVLDLAARQRATSFYTPTGEAIYPMLPREISEERASLLPALLTEREVKPTVSLCFTYNTKTQNISKPIWQLTTTQTTASYTYEEANESLKKSQELKILSACASRIAQTPLTDSHEWVEKMMIFYNQQAGEELARNRAGILRRHAEASAQAITNVPEFLFYESAEYCLATAEHTRHYGLNSEFYAYASSPIRRYADLVNQRAIKKILVNDTPTPLTQDLVDELNRRQKQAKAFSRDLFFMSSLSNPSQECVKGIVISQNPEQTKTKIWVPQWKRKITTKNIVPQAFAQGTEMEIQWYQANDQPHWKDRIVFKLVAK